MSLIPNSRTPFFVNASTHDSCCQHIFRCFQAPGAAILKKKKESIDRSVSSLTPLLSTICLQRGVRPTTLRDKHTVHYRAAWLVNKLSWSCIRSVFVSQHYFRLLFSWGSHSSHLTSIGVWDKAAICHVLSVDTQHRNLAVALYLPDGFLPAGLGFLAYFNCTDDLIVYWQS